MILSVLSINELKLFDLIDKHFKKLSKSCQQILTMHFQGKKIAEIIKDMKMVAKGVDNVRIVHEISTKNKIEMPITNSVYNIIYNNVEPTDELKNLFARSLKKEIW